MSRQPTFAGFPAVRICNMSRQVGGLQAYVESTIAMRAEFIQLRDGAGGGIPEGNILTGKLDLCMRVLAGSARR